MDFREMAFSKTKLFLLFPLILMLAACGEKLSSTEKEENVIGVPVEKISSLVKMDGGDSEQMAVFDEVTKRIHQFRMSDMSFIRSLSVKSPDSKHSVIAHEKGNYVIDMYDQHVEIFDRSGNVTIDPIEMVGAPVSVAYRSDLNLFVLYDNLNSVVFIQLDSVGQVVDSWVGGSLIASQQSITSGDLLASGKLVLSLSDNSLAVVDVADTLKQKKWSFTTLTPAMTGMTGISWLAPVSDNQNQIVAKGLNEIAIIDLSSQSKVSSKALDGLDLEKLSKSSDAHIIARNHISSKEVNLFYAQSSALQIRTLQKQGLFIVSSQLSLAKDRWSFVDSNLKKINFYDNTVDQVKQDRVLKMYRLSDMLAKKKMDVANDAQILISSNSLFELFPSELGWAVRHDLESGASSEAKFFNVGPLRQK